MPAVFLRCAKRRPEFFRSLPRLRSIGRAALSRKGKFRHIAGTRANRGLDVCHRSGSLWAG